MKGLAVLRIALRSLRRTPMRSCLTVLGVVIGVTAVIALVSIGSGARAQIEESMAKLDLSLITLTARPALGAGNTASLAAGEGLRIEDYKAIRDEIGNVVAVSPVAFTRSGEARTNGRHTEAMLSGIDVAGFEVISRHLSSGASFGEADVHRAASVCLITQFIADTLFSGQQAVGRHINLNGIPFLVIGVLTNNELPTVGDDTAIFMPFTSLLQRINRNAEVTVLVKAKSPEFVEELRRTLLDFMERRRGTRKAEFRSLTSVELLNFRTESARTMTLLLGAIAAISLLVGGIGIMNIMLVNVTERTREIGIRLAVGTRNRDLLRQFLIEAVVLSGMGGLIGIVFGAGLAHVISHVNDWPTRVTPLSMLGAFICSAAIGVFFGYFPARQAARLDPIEALRAE